VRRAAGDGEPDIVPVPEHDLQELDPTKDDEGGGSVIWKVTYDDVSADCDWIKSDRVVDVLRLIPDLDEATFDRLSIKAVHEDEPISLVAYAPDDLMEHIDKLPPGVHIEELEGGGFGLKMTAVQWDESFTCDGPICSTRWES
jgi:hypothetical protein